MRLISIRLFAAAALLGAVAGCTPTIDIRGNVPPPDRLDEIKVGKMGKSDVMALIGTPSNTTTFGDDTWYYIASKIKTYAFYSPEELERQVVVVDFEKTGMVKNVQTLTLKDGKVVNLVSRETPAPGRDLTVIEQLLGNVGRFSKQSAGPGK